MQMDNTQITGVYGTKTQLKHFHNVPNGASQQTCIDRQTDRWEYIWGYAKISIIFCGMPMGPS